MFVEMLSGFASEKNALDLLETGTKWSSFSFASGLDQRISEISGCLTVKHSTMFTSWPLKQDTVSAVLRGTGIIVCAFFNEE